MRRGRGQGIRTVSVVLLLLIAVPEKLPAQTTSPGSDPLQPPPVSLITRESQDWVFPAPVVPSRTALQPEWLQEPRPVLPPGTSLPVPASKPRRFTFTRRYGTPNTISREILPDKSERWVFLGGVIINAVSDDGEQIELATDQGVVWVRGATVDPLPSGFQTSGDDRTQVEVYLRGNVVVRTKTAKGPLQTLRAAEVYYDVEHQRAIALEGSLAFQPPQSPDPVHLFGAEVRRLDAENWEILKGSVNASKLPSDSVFRLDANRVTYEERYTQLTNVFGIPYRDLRTGELVYGREQLVTAYGAIPRVLGLPIAWFPRIRAEAGDPLGPFVGFSFGQNRIFGSQFYTTWDLFDLLALRPPPGQKLRLNLDYLSKRGPALGPEYFYNVPAEVPGLAATTGRALFYGVWDDGADILGGNRGPEPPKPYFRHRFLWRHQQELLDGLYFQGQLAHLSDKNFFEQYYKIEFDTDVNQETFAYLTYNRGKWWAAGLVEPRWDRPWNPETQWLPRVDGGLIGQTFLDDLFVYSARITAGYARARPAQQPPFSLLPTDVSINTGRIGWLEEISMPFALGPVKLAPYGMLDLIGYTDDLAGNSIGRVWGGGGTRLSLPMSRLYDDISSDLFNVRGLYHKVVWGANYFYARTNVPFTQLPLLDRLNDDATDQSWRTITPMQPAYLAGSDGLLLAAAANPNSPYNPQRYLIRRQVLNRLDTLDDLHVLQLDVRQRWQTKRGAPGQEHTVDVAVLSTSISYFPQADRDNFGKPFAFLEYDFLWNIGDRTAFTATGWFEPYDNGSRYFTFGTFFNRPDRTTFYLGYRQIDPINSRAVIASVGYVLSRRYYFMASSSYDFGLNQALTNAITLTRTGTDMTVSIGFTYNSLVNNFGFQFLIVPNVLAALTGQGRFAGMPLGMVNPMVSQGIQRGR
ncbi:MAG: hypothetical protein NZ703_00635 [Gemmataceae bacterium]|nr:hypothetical protein [Gemmataceae bacterium]